MKLRIEGQKSAVGSRQLAVKNLALLAFFLLTANCGLSTLFAATKTVTGKITDSTGTAVAGAIVEFRLVNWGAANMPRVAGTSIDLIKPVPATTAADGTWSVELHGNETITPTGTLYEFSVRGPGVTQGGANYEITGSGSVDLSTLMPVGAIAPAAFPRAYATIEQAATALTQRQIVNFSGTGLTCVDNSADLRTDCAINGIPSVAGQASSLDFYAAVSTANVLASTVASVGRYRVGYYMFETASGSGGTCASNATATVTLGWTDPGDGAGQAQTKADAPLELPPTLAAGAYQQDQIVIAAQASTAITYAIAWSDGDCTAQPTASVYLFAEAVQ